MTDKSKTGKAAAAAYAGQPNPEAGHGLDTYQQVTQVASFIGLALVKRAETSGVSKTGIVNDALIRYFGLEGQAEALGYNPLAKVGRQAGPKVSKETTTAVKAMEKAAKEARKASKAAAMAAYQKERAALIMSFHTGEIDMTQFTSMSTALMEKYNIS